MDKLVGNAVDLSVNDEPVKVKVDMDDTGWSIEVSNTGPLLPEEMESQLFNSMISIRDKKDKKEPHLGLGLYLVRLIAEIHHASASARNNPDQTGVIFNIKFD
jgi:K+-sensing histidine kinase KdpD